MSTLAPPSGKTTDRPPPDALYWRVVPFLDLPAIDAALAELGVRPAA